MMYALQVAVVGGAVEKSDLHTVVKQTDGTYATYSRDPLVASTLAEIMTEIVLPYVVAIDTGESVRVSLGDERRVYIGKVIKARGQQVKLIVDEPDLVVSMETTTINVKHLRLPLLSIFKLLTFAS